MFVRVRAPLIVSSIFACFTFAYTTEAPIIKDASQYTGAAYYLLHAGVLDRGVRPQRHRYEMWRTASQCAAASGRG